MLKQVIRHEIKLGILATCSFVGFLYLLVSRYNEVPAKAEKQVAKVVAEVVPPRKKPTPPRPERVAKVKLEPGHVTLPNQGGIEYVPPGITPPDPTRPSIPIPELPSDPLSPPAPPDTSPLPEVKPVPFDPPPQLALPQLPPASPDIAIVPPVEVIPSPPEVKPEPPPVPVIPSPPEVKPEPILPPPVEIGEIKPLPVVRPGSRPARAKVLPLTGTYPCNLDAKRMITLPRAMRDQIDPGEAVLVSPGPDHCLWVTTPEQLERLARRVEASPARDNEVRGFRRLYFAQTEKLTLSPEGRMRIPERLTKFAGLHEEVVLIGVDDHFELWDVARWRQYSQAKSAAARAAMSED
jgi:MraZ protein